jgi:hypothetical protein
MVAWVAAWNGVSQVGGLGEAQWEERIQPSLNVQFGNWPHRILSNWARITGKKFGQTDLSSVFLDLHWASSIKNGFGLNYCDFHRLFRKPTRSVASEFFQGVKPCGEDEKLR